MLAGKFVSVTVFFCCNLIPDIVIWILAKIVKRRYLTWEVVEL